jgi:hypothetical protein
MQACGSSVAEASILQSVLACGNLLAEHYSGTVLSGVWRRNGSLELIDGLQMRERNSSGQFLFPPLPPSKKPAPFSRNLKRLRTLAPEDMSGPAELTWAAIDPKTSLMS